MYKLGPIGVLSLVRVGTYLRISGCAAAAVFGASLFAQQSASAQQSPFAQQSVATPLLIRDVTIIDCAGHAPRPAMSVLISGGRIAAIGPAARIKATRTRRYSTAAENI